MARLAFLTFGLLKEPWGAPAVAGFEERVPGNFAAAAASSGFLARSGLDGVSWGEWIYPVSLPAETYPRLARTLSLWESLEAVYAFAYSGSHAESLRHRKEWVNEFPLPTYVAWWVADSHTPTWAESNDRLTQLHNDGPTPAAFTFKSAFTPEGESYVLDSARVKTLLVR